MSKSQTDGFSEADGILSPSQRGRGGETKAQGMGLGWGVTGPHSGQPLSLSLSHLHVAQTAWAVQAPNTPL